MLYYFFFLNLLGSTSWGTCRGGWDISFFWESTPGEGPILFEEGFKKKNFLRKYLFLILFEICFNMYIFICDMYIFKFDM